MQIFIIAVIAVVVVVVVGLVLAQGTARFDEAVQKNRAEMENNPDPKPDFAVQLHEARVLAAKQAAAMPRGANMRIGRLGQADELKTAWQGVEDDPVTAVKIATFHGWDGLKTGAVVPPPTTSAPALAPAVDSKAKLVPGKDYSVIEITDDMSPAEKRKARIANVKAKSAARKAAKAGAAPAMASATTTAPAATAVAIPEPELIEITDDMPPDEKRKARIANSKAKSAYKKALKAAGIDPKVAKATAPTAVPEPAGADVPSPPELIELTDDMAPEDKRAARIANSKAKSAYKKALKAAGIDPKSVKI